jgi:hypothetical protein
VVTRLPRRENQLDVELLRIVGLLRVHHGSQRVDAVGSEHLGESSEQLATRDCANAWFHHEREIAVPQRIPAPGTECDEEVE